MPDMPERAVVNHREASGLRGGLPSTSPNDFVKPIPGQFPPVDNHSLRCRACDGLSTAPLEIGR